MDLHPQEVLLSERPYPPSPPPTQPHACTGMYHGGVRTVPTQCTGCSEIKFIQLSKFSLQLKSEKLFDSEKVFPFKKSFRIIGLNSNKNISESKGFFRNGICPGRGNEQKSFSGHPVLEQDHVVSLVYIDISFLVLF